VVEKVVVGPKAALVMANTFGKDAGVRHTDGSIELECCGANIPIAPPISFVSHFRVEGRGEESEQNAALICEKAL